MTYCTKHQTSQLSADGSCPICWLEEVRTPDDGQEAPKAAAAAASAGTAFLPHPDITKSRHKGNEFSAAANPEASKKSRDMEAIYREFLGRGTAGCTREDAYKSAGYDDGTSTGAARCSDLVRGGHIVEVWEADGTQRRARTVSGATAGVWCADKHGKPRPKP